MGESHSWICYLSIYLKDTFGRRCNESGGFIDRALEQSRAVPPRA